MASRAVKQPPITILTGKSGSGKSTALGAFEDYGYYCVDNMPVAMLPAFLELSPGYAANASGLVFGMDLRDSHYIHQYQTIVDRLNAKGYRFRLIFFDADEKSLLRRYSQTRRRHPLAMEKGLVDAILTEESLLSALRRSADYIVDTSHLNVHDLKAIIRKLAHVGSHQGPMQVQVISFGYKFGLPAHADLVMDVRFIKNPYFVESLRPLSGESEAIRSFVLNNEQTGLFLSRYLDLLDGLIPQYENEGKAYLTIGIGCTGGRHRSVVIAGRLYDHIAATGRKADLVHRDIDKSVSP